MTTEEREKVRYYYMRIDGMDFYIEPTTGAYIDGRTIDPESQEMVWIVSIWGEKVKIRISKVSVIMPCYELAWGWIRDHFRGYEGDRKLIIPLTDDEKREFQGQRSEI